MKTNRHKACPGSPGALSTGLGLGPPSPIPTSVLGLGDAIKRVTTAVGIKHCKGCQKRAEKLNRLFPLRQSKR